MPEQKLTIVGSNHDCLSAPMTAELKAPGGFKGIKLVDAESKIPLPCQWEKAGETVRLSWIIAGLESGQQKEYNVIFADETINPEGSQVTVTEAGEGRLDIEIGGAFFTSYYYGEEVIRPYLHPVIGPYGKSVTRGYPMVTDVPGESTDHQHHRAIYVAHGEVNGVDNWSESPNCGGIVHRSFDVVSSGPVYGHIVDRLDWVSNQGEPVLKEVREWKFYNVSPSKIVDVNLTFTSPADTDVVFGDTKEGGLLSLRVAGTMKVSSGGKMENSFGGVNEPEVWGKRAHWCDYSGPVDNQWVGVALFDHPKNLRHPTYWHARNYGLMTANPFGISTFEGDPSRNGDYTLSAGTELKCRYRIYIHKGDAGEGKVAEKYHNYINPPKVQV
ncbi:MAG: PmoA family protein [Candidatus Poribacteria bacterium]